MHLSSQLLMIRQEESTPTLMLVRALLTEAHEEMLLVLVVSVVMARVAMVHSILFVSIHRKETKVEWKKILLNASLLCEILLDDF